MPGRMRKDAIQGGFECFVHLIEVRGNTLG